MKYILKCIKSHNSDKIFFAQRFSVGDYVSEEFGPVDFEDASIYHYADKGNPLYDPRYFKFVKWSSEYKGRYRKTAKKILTLFKRITGRPYDDEQDLSGDLENSLIEILSKNH